MYIERRFHRSGIMAPTQATKNSCISSLGESEREREAKNLMMLNEKNLLNKELQGAHLDGIERMAREDSADSSGSAGNEVLDLARPLLFRHFGSWKTWWG